jgi:hypothetical protein
MEYIVNKLVNQFVLIKKSSSSNLIFLKTLRVV